MSDEPFPGSAADFYERIQEYKGIGERLRESDERLSAALEEIERLETINSSRTKMAIIEMQSALRERNALITELCDALSDNIPPGLGRTEWDLIQRAREATK